MFLVQPSLHPSTDPSGHRSIRSQDVALTYRILQYTNSTGMALRSDGPAS